MLPMIAELKQNVLVKENPACKYLESYNWNQERSFVDANYRQEPDVYAGYYEVVEVGNGGRELALKDFDGRVFVVHQDYASIVVG